jgi:hypothetical protein
MAKITSVYIDETILGRAHERAILEDRSMSSLMARALSAYLAPAKDEEAGNCMSGSSGNLAAVELRRADHRERGADGARVTAAEHEHETITDYTRHSTAPAVTLDGPAPILTPAAARDERPGGPDPAGAFTAARADSARSPQGRAHRIAGAPLSGRGAYRKDRPARSGPAISPERAPSKWHSI